MFVNHLTSLTKRDNLCFTTSQGHCKDRTIHLGTILLNMCIVLHSVWNIALSLLSFWFSPQLWCRCYALFTNEEIMLTGIIRIFKVIHLELVEVWKPNSCVLTLNPVFLLQRNNHSPNYSCNSTYTFCMVGVANIFISIIEKILNA